MPPLDARCAQSRSQYPTQPFLLVIKDLDTGDYRTHSLSPDTVQRLDQLLKETTMSGRVFQIDRDAQANLPLTMRRDELSLILEAIEESRVPPPGSG